MGKLKYTAQYLIGSIPDEELKIFFEKTKDHQCKDYTWQFRYDTGSAIGTNFVAICNRCGDEFDITDYESW